MTHIHHHQVTEAQLVAAIVEAGKAIYQAETSVAKTLADGSQQQVTLSENLVHTAEQDLQKAVTDFHKYEAEKRDASHASFWGSLLTYAALAVGAVALCFGQPEFLLMTIAITAAQKSGLSNKAEHALGNAIGSQLAASFICTIALVAIGVATGAGAGALADDAGSVATEEAASSVATSAGESAAESASSATAEDTGSSVASKVKAAGKSVSKKIASLSRPTATGLFAGGQGLQTFNVGGEVEASMAKLHAKWATALGITLEVLIDLVAVVCEGAGAGNGMMRASAAGKGVFGSSVLSANVNLLKAAGAIGAVSGVGESACGIATSAMEMKEANALLLYAKAEGASQLIDSLKELSHEGFTAWSNSYQAVEQTLAKQAADVGNSISAVNTQLAIAMSGRG